MPSALESKQALYKRFGFNQYEAAAPRLCRQLKLSNNPRVFKNIQTTIENLRERYLDINAPVSQQKDAMSLIEDKIISKHPYLFSGKVNEASLFFALRLVERKHRCKRKQLLANARKRKKRLAERQNAPPPPKEILDLTLDEGSDSHSESSSNLDGDENVAPSKAFRPHPIPNEPLSLARRMPLNARPAPNTGSSVRVTNGSESSYNAKNKRPSTTSTKPSAKQTSQTSHVLEVQQFLSECYPPMDHLLQNFINFGCNTQEFLRGISSWAPEKRLGILKKILSGCKDGGGVTATEMEIAVIENKLETYFVDEET